MSDDMTAPPILRGLYAPPKAEPRAGIPPRGPQPAEGVEPPPVHIDLVVPQPPSEASAARRRATPSRPNVRTAPAQVVRDGGVRFAPPLPEPAPRDRPSSVPLNAPIEPTVDLSPLTRDPIVRANPGAILASVRSADAEANLVSTDGGRVRSLTIAPGTQLPVSMSIRDGVLTQARVDVLDRHGRPSYLNGPVDISGIDLTNDRRVVPRIRSAFTRFFAGIFGMNDQTSAIFSGQRRVPVDPHLFFQSLGLGREIPLIGPGREERAPNRELAELRRAIDEQRSPVRATVDLTPSRNGEMVQFGEGLKLAFAPGSRATYVRENGLDRYEIDANLSGARFGVEDGPNLRIGRASLRIVLQERQESGRSRWVVTVANAQTQNGTGVIENVRLRTPVAGARPGEELTNELNLGNVSLSNGANPIIAMANGKLTVGFDTQLDAVHGALHLRDAQGRQGELTLGNRDRRDNLRVAARIDLTTDAAHPLRVERMRVEADTNGLNVGLNAPRGVLLASGDGFGFGVQSGTSLVGSGRLTYTMGGPEGTNFTLASQHGVRADVRLFGTHVNRSLGEIGMRTDVANGSLLRAQVRSLDWASRAVDMRAEFDATLARATVRLPTTEQATLTNASGRGQASIRYRAGDISPEIRGTVNLRVAAPRPGSGEQPAGFSFLPSGVPGFDGARAEAGIHVQGVGDVDIAVPFTVTRDGAFSTRDGAVTEGRVNFERLAIDTLYNTEGARNSGLPMYTDVTNARARHESLRRSLEMLPIPALVSGAGSSPRESLDSVTRTLDVAAMVTRGLREADLDLTVNIPRAHTIRLTDGIIADSGARELTFQQGSVRLVLETDGGRITPQLATRPDGTPNPTGGLPSGISFNPPLRLTFNPSSNGRWYNTPFESHMEFAGLDIVPSASNPDQITFRPRVTRATFGDAAIYNGIHVASGWLGQESALNGYLTGQVMEMATGSRELPTTVQELAARAARHLDVRIDTRPDLIERALERVPEQDRRFVRDVLVSAEVRARAQINPGQTIQMGANRLTIAAAEDVRVVRVDGRTEVTAQVTFGDSLVRSADGANMSLSGVSARIRLVQTGDPRSPSATDLTLTEVRAPALTFQQADRQTFSIRDGGARRISIAQDGSITTDGLHGTFSGNLMYNGSQLWVQSSRLADGSPAFENGFLRTGDLRLTDVVGTATNFEIPPETSDPSASGVSARLRRVDFRAAAATLTVSRETGISLVMPREQRATVGVQVENATFVFPSPRMSVLVSNAMATGALESLHIGPDRKQILMHDWYLETDASSGEVTGTIVAGPPGSQASNLRIEPTWLDRTDPRRPVTRRSRLQIFLGSMGFTQQGRDQRVDARLAGRLEGNFRLPEREPPPPGDEQPASYVRSAGQFNGTIDFSMRSDGRPISATLRSTDAPAEISARAHAVLTNGTLTFDGAMNPEDALRNARDTGEAIRRRWNAAKPEPAATAPLAPAPEPAAPAAERRSPATTETVPRVPSPSTGEADRVRRERAAAQAEERRRRRLIEEQWNPFQRDRN